MKALIIHQHFNTPESGGPLRSYYIAKALVQRGIWPVVITAHNSGSYRVEIREGFEIHYLPVQYENRFGFYKRTIAFLKFAWLAYRAAGKYKRAGVCYAISVPMTVGLSALAIRQRYHIPYIFEVGDLWPDAPIEMGFVRNKVLQRLLYRLEHRIYKNAHAIVALSQPIRNRVIEKTEPGKVHVIENMSDIEYLTPGKKDPQLEEKFSVKEKFVISYTGAIGYANGLNFLLLAAMACERAGLPVHFLVAGGGAEEEEIKSRAHEYQLRNLSFLGFQNREGVRDILKVSDACLISYRNERILETGSPNKYFDALAAGKLVIINFGGWIRAEIESSGCGFFVNEGRPADIVQNLITYLNDKEAVAKSQSASRALAEKKYARTYLSRKVADLVEACSMLR